MRTAVERLWRAIGAADRSAIVAQLHRDAQIWQGDSGETLGRADYVARQIAAGPGAVDVERDLQQSDVAAIEVRVTRRGGLRRCAGFYDLRDGRIFRGAEYWGPAAPPPGR